MSDEQEHRVSLRHPESGAIDCTLPVTTCAGPCCGTCNPSEIGLIATGNKVDFVALWQDEGSLGLQFRVSRGRLGKGIASKYGPAVCMRLRDCARRSCSRLLAVSGLAHDNRYLRRWKDVQQLQLLTNDDAFACLAAADAAKHGCKAAPSIISQAEAPCSATSGHRGILFDISALTKSSTFAIKRPAPVATESPITYGLEHICAQNVLPLQQVRLRASLIDYHTHGHVPCSVGLRCTQRRSMLCNALTADDGVSVVLTPACVDLAGGDGQERLQGNVRRAHHLQTRRLRIRRVR